MLHEEVFAPEAPSRLRASRVSFTPGGRTNWHTHAVGQVLYVLSGVGRYQTLGEPVQVLLPGDTVVIPPDVKHWHGAAPDHMMAHLAMSGVQREGRGHHLARARQRGRLHQGAHQAGVAPPSPLPLEGGGRCVRDLDGDRLHHRHTQPAD